MEKGLYLLSEDALTHFVSLSLEKFEQNQKLGIKFLSLVSKLGLDTCSEMQVSVSFSQLRQQLNRYLRARTGIPISVRLLSSMSKSLRSTQLTPSLPGESDPHPLVCSDGKFIYLPDEISIFPSKAENASLYKCLTKIESAYYEFRTFDFDLEKAMERCSFEKQADSQGQADDLSDFERFFSLFPNAVLAADLFTIFEHGRIRVMLKRFYPGIVRQYFPMLGQEWDRTDKRRGRSEILSLFYLRIALGIFPEEPPPIVWNQISNYADLFEKKVTEDHSVETCAEMVFKAYEALENQVQGPLETPFGRKLRPDLFFSAFRNLDRISKQLKVRLEEKGLKAYQSDIRKHMIENNGNLSFENVREIVLQRGGQDHEMENISSEEIREILRHTDIQYPLSQTEDSDAVAWYKEWDCNLGDYVRDHVRVLDKTVCGSESDFYSLTLARHQGLVKQIRHAFELLKPEGLLLLRQWVEGDEFDYRALLDFALDRKAGIMPSDRLYIKRVKQQRDVAVLLLVDISRSTSNLVSADPGQREAATVLDVEKEAIVLFCEALELVGDTFAIAGFSGTGRLGVDYFRIKDFENPMDDTIRNRISAMSPQRSTRMGGAIRHATRELEKVAAKVRLMIILGDGFPNDTNYKREYATEDTHRAISEASAKSIHTRAITVNIAGDSKLDDLYGNMHHNVISDVRELPDKLLRIYRAMTR